MEGNSRWQSVSFGRSRETTFCGSATRPCFGDLQGRRFLCHSKVDRGWARPRLSRYSEAVSSVDIVGVNVSDDWVGIGTGEPFFGKAFFVVAFCTVLAGFLVGGAFFATAFTIAAFPAGTAAFFTGLFFAGAVAFFGTATGVVTFTAFLLLAQRFVCAAAMRALPSSLIIRLPDTLAFGFAVVEGRPRRGSAAAEIPDDVEPTPIRISRACCSWAISKSRARRTSGIFMRQAYLQTRQTQNTSGFLRLYASQMGSPQRLGVPSRN